MSRPLVITVVTHGDDLEQHVPAGFLYVDQMYEEAGLRDSISANQVDSFWRRLRIFRRALAKEFGDAVKLRVLNPWTPEGLWFVFRHRLREFPVVVIGNKPYPSDSQLDILLEAVRQGI